MLSNVRLEDLYSLDIIERSFTNVNDLIFPLKVHVGDIDNKYDDDEFYQVNFVDNRDEYIYEIDSTNENPYEREQELFELRKRIKFIYKFIDKDIKDEDGRTVLSLIEADTEDSFVDFVLNSSLFSMSDITKIEYEIRFHIGRVKNRFMQKAINIFQLNDSLPEIHLEEENQTPANWAKHMSYNICMLSLQSVSELPMTIWFSENINKAYMEWSWREMELKRLYITAKTRTENFRELVKAKQFEEKMAKNKNNKSRGR